MAFDYDTARSAQSQYDKQAAANKFDADQQRRYAEQARQAQDHASEREHSKRAAFLDLQSQRFIDLSQNMQTQMETARAAERAPDNADIIAELERAIALANEQSAKIAAAEAERERQEEARQEAERQRAQARLDTFFDDADRRGAELRQGRDGKEVE